MVIGPVMVVREEMPGTGWAGGSDEIVDPIPHLRNSPHGWREQEQGIGWCPTSIHKRLI
jgi:hypothetical protein